MKTLSRFSQAAALLLLATTAPAFAGPPMDAKTFKETVAPPPAIPSDEFSITSSYVGKSDFKGDYRKDGQQEAWEESASYSHRIPLTEHFYLRIGASYSRFDFQSSGAPVPNHLQSAALDLALEYKVNGQTGFFVEASPGLYFANNAVSASSFDAPITLALAYPIFGGNRFYLVAGVTYSSLRAYTLFPVLGIDWAITDQLHLKLYGTDPRLSYMPCPDWELFAGGQLAGGSFYVENASTKDPDHNGAQRFGGKLDYYEYRGSAGIAYHGFKPFTVEVSAGYVFDREFHFHEEKERVRLDGAPFVQVALSAAF